jgi:signal transduction histidine kinase
MDRTESPEVKPEVAARGAEGSDERAGHLGFVAHEIRNPLSTALWTAEMLARMTTQDRGGARGEKLSAMCLRSVTRVRQLVEDHFMCERLDAGGLPLRVEAVGAKEALDAVLERHPAETASSDVDPLLGVQVDRGLLERALEAMVAVAGAERTPVTIVAHATDGDVGFEVHGRRAEQAALADPTKGSPSDPSGRALAIPLARRIAAALGGGLTVQEGRWLLTVPRARAYTPRPAPAANP